MENTPDVSGNPSPVVSEDLQTQTQLPEAPVVTSSVATPPGAKTPPENLYAALAEERKLRKEAEDKIINLTTTVSSDDDVYSDEGRVLKSQIASVQAKLDAMEEERDLERLYAQYPMLKDKAGEFIEYRKAEHPRAKLASVAKLFLSENDLLTPRREGLEKPTGGPRVPVTSGMTRDDVEKLRTTNFRLYQDMIMKGLINIES